MQQGFHSRGPYAIYYFKNDRKSALHLSLFMDPATMQVASVVASHSCAAINNSAIEAPGRKYE